MGNSSLWVIASGTAKEERYANDPLHNDCLRRAGIAPYAGSPGPCAANDFYVQPQSNEFARPMVSATTAFHRHQATGW